MAIKNYQKDGSVIHHTDTRLVSLLQGEEIVPAFAVRTAQAMEAARAAGIAAGQMEAMRVSAEIAKAKDLQRQKQQLLADQVQMLTQAVRKMLREKAEASLGDPPCAYAHSMEGGRINLRGMRRV